MKQPISKKTSQYCELAVNRRDLPSAQPWSISLYFKVARSDDPAIVSWASVVFEIGDARPVEGGIVPRKSIRGVLTHATTEGNRS